MASTSALSEEIDRLLEQYLELLDQYTTLRTQLSTLQSSVHQHIARANFSAERGVRYGPDFYDARMQATRVCRITVPTLSESGSGKGTAAPPSTHPSGDVEPRTAATSEHEFTHGREGPAWHARNPGTACFAISAAPRIAAQGKPAQPSTGGGTATEEDGGSEGGDGADAKKTKSAARDPIRMFGFMVPQSLRHAQRESITSIEGIVPKLASIDAAMKELEVQIRRARKHRLKAERKDIREKPQGKSTDQACGMKETGPAIEAS